MPLALARTSLRTPAGSSATQSAGSRGAAVEALQRTLAAAGFPPGPIDGDFGAQTRSAVKRFQLANGLTVDGVAGPETWAALRGARPSAPPPPVVGAVLRQGDFGAEVEALQQALERHGFSTGGVDGTFGGQMRAAVVAFQRAKGLSADGVVGASTWRALKGPVETRPTAPPVSGDMRARVLDAARGELGTLERGSNGGEVLKYPRFFGRGAEPYCADFVSWVMRQSGGRMNDPYCPSVVNELKDRGLWKGRSNPQPGDMVLFDWDHDGTADHIGVVERVNADGSIGTIEANTTNPQTGQEGVWRRTRSRDAVLGFGAPY